MSAHSPDQSATLAVSTVGCVEMQSDQDERQHAVGDSGRVRYWVQRSTFSLTASTTCCAAPSVASLRRFRASSAALDAWSAAFWPPSCCAATSCISIRCAGSFAHSALPSNTSASKSLRGPKYCRHHSSAVLPLTWLSLASDEATVNGWADEVCGRLCNHCEQHCHKLLDGNLD